MGSLAKQTRTRRGVRLGVLLLVAAAIAPGCDTKTDKGTISASAFSAVQLVQNGIRVLSNKLELLRAILPGERDSALLQLPAEGQPFAKLDDELIGIFETRNGAVCSVDLCPDCRGAARAEVRLHYSRIGLEVELDDAGAVLPALSEDVPAIELDNGWTVAFESSSRSLVAFRVDDEFRPADPRDENDPNFGRGNGLVMSLVISGPELQRQLQTDSIPRITRIHDMGDGKIMLFFQEIFREVHILRVSESFENVDYDLSDADDNPATIRVAAMLRGTLLRPGDPPGARPEPFLTFDEILDATQGLFLDIDSFQPVRIPSDDSTLVFDTVQSVFLRFFEDDVTGFGTVLEAASSTAVSNALLSAATPFDMAQSWRHPSRSEILIYEERTNTLIGYSFTQPNPDQSLRTVVNSVNIVSNRRDPAGGGPIIPGGGQEPILQPAENDISGVGQRLLFDQGRDELISVAYSNGVVVIVGKRDEFSLVTGEPLVHLSYVEVVGGSGSGVRELRAWDLESSTLLEILVDFTILPDLAN